MHALEYMVIYGIHLGRSTRFNRSIMLEELIMNADQKLSLPPWLYTVVISMHSNFNPECNAEVYQVVVYRYLDKEKPKSELSPVLAIR